VTLSSPRVWRLLYFSGTVKLLLSPGKAWGLPKGNYSGMSFWARGYFISTVGADEEVVRAYIRGQEKEDLHVKQLTLFK
jgi:putative transposase